MGLYHVLGRLFFTTLISRQAIFELRPVGSRFWGSREEPSLLAQTELCYRTLRGKVSMADTETKSIFDLEPDEAAEAAADAVADAEIEAGKGVPHEEVREWLLKLAKGEKLPPPIP
jgi:predicted transcriptional regulator